MTDFDVLGRIVVDDEGANSSIGDLGSMLSEAATQGGIVGGVVSTLGGILTDVLEEAANAAAEALRNVVDAIVEMAQAGMTEQDNQTKLAAILENTGKKSGITTEQVNAYSQSMIGVTRFSHDATIEAATMMVRFGSISKETFPQAMTAAEELATTMGQSLPAAAMNLSRSLGNPEMAARTLRLAGITLTDQEKQQIKVWDLYGQSGKSQAFILDKITSSLGGVAEQMGGTTAGKLEIFKNKMAEVQDNLGSYMLPAILDVGNALADRLAPVLEELAPKLGPLFEDLGNIFTTTLLPILVDNIIPAFESMKEPLTIVEGLITHLGKGDTAGALNILSFAFGGLGPQIAAVKSWLTTMLPAWDSFKITLQFLTPIIQKIGDYFVMEFGKIVQWFQTNQPLIGAFVNKLVQIFGDIAVGMGNLLVAISPLLDGLVTLILGMVKIIMQIVTGDWAGAWLTLKQSAMVALSDVLSAILRFFDWVLSYFNTNLAAVGVVWKNDWAGMVIIVTKWWEDVKTKFVTFVADMKALGLKVVISFAEGIKNGASNVINALMAVVNKAVAAVIVMLSSAGKHSPLMWDITYQMMGDMGKGIDHSISIPVDAMVRGMGTIASAAANPAAYGQSYSYNTVNSGGNFNNMGLVTIQLEGGNPGMNDFLDSIRRISQ